uniref:NAD(P)-binding domain-containing protein n=1 Tax=Chlorobium chlorochromatii (strain CaD3) TaxID=340177 RepID=Q3ATL8_CHLCH
MKKVLVAGATGYLGRYAVEAFKKRGYWVRALVRNLDKAKQPGPYFAPEIASLADEIVVGDATLPATIATVCDGIDVVFSSLGMIKPDFVHTIFEVDYQANMNLLDLALKAKVKKFIYVSVYDAHRMMNIPNVQAHEKFVRELKAAKIDSTIIRPNGFFSEIGQFVARAHKGFMLLVGDGYQRSNPIHGADLAEVCVDAVDRSDKEIGVGGPEIFTYQEMMDLAIEIAQNQPFIFPLPLWAADTLVAATGLVNRDVHDVALFATTLSRIDVVSPEYGTHRLRDFFMQCKAAL